MKEDYLVRIDGRTAQLGVWAKEYGISISAIENRVKLGLTLVEAITVPKNQIREFLKKKHERQRRTILVKEKDLKVEVRNEKRAAPVRKRKRPVVFYRASSGSGYYDYAPED